MCVFSLQSEGDWGVAGEDRLNPPPKALSRRSHTDMHTPAEAPSVIGRFERTQPVIGRFLSLNRSKRSLGVRT